MKLPAKRIQQVQAPIIPIVGQLIRENPGTISLGQGVVNYGPPASIYPKIQNFGADATDHLYKAVQGVPELIEAIHKKLAEDNGIIVSPKQRVVVTAGANLGFSNAIFAITNPGDEVILLTPYYFNHEMAITIAGCTPVLVKTDGLYQPILSEIEAAIGPKTRAVVTVSPNNPSGVVYSPEVLQLINTLCRDRGIYHIHDQAYEYFLYNKVEAFSVGSLAGTEDHTISLYSLSKAYGFASWRIGYMLLPGFLFEAIEKIQDTFLICPTVIAQRAAVEAMAVGKDYIYDKSQSILTNRKIFSEALARISDICTVPPSDGAFYFLLNIHTDMSSMDLMKRLIREHKVATIPGETFGLMEGCFLRIAYGKLFEEDAIEGIQRLVNGLRAIVKN